MLELKQICKEYASGADGVRALCGVSINFRRNEFVSILGPSGCGKTTLLNIIGGLDRYTTGDLVINGRSTKDYRDGDWDVYRNRSIGFVFQSYNLIPHQSVLSNVELALTLSGVSKAERRRRAVEALEKVGLGDQIRKRPSQMSGGQMQRVAIARALVNNPEILLADEPTGALDTATSEQVMELLHEVARDRLVIMVTHNPDLAERYSTRIISLRDGAVVGDSMPYDPSQEAMAESTGDSAPVPTALPEKKTEKKAKKKPMSHITAISLSKNNLMTKKGRTFLTSFAGSIGIIGIALILSLSNGINNYINSVQKDTLSGYPIQLMAEELDMMSIMATLMESEEKKLERDPDRVYANTVMYEMLEAYTGTDTKKNNLAAFKDHLESNPEFDKYATAIQYTYKTPFYIYANTEFGLKQVEPSTVFDSVIPEGMMGGMSNMMSSSMMGSSPVSVWSELLSAKGSSDINSLIYEQYDLVHGSWPKEKNDLVLILNSNNEVSDMSLYSLGLKDSDEIADMMKDIFAGNMQKDYGDESYSYEEICSLTYKLLLPDDYYKYNALTGTYTDLRQNESAMNLIMGDEDSGIELRVVGIIKPNPDALSTALSGTVGYTSALTEYVIEQTNSSEIVKAQLENSTTDLVSGLPFITGEEKELTPAEKKQAFSDHVAKLTEAQKAELMMTIAKTPSEEQLAAAVMQILAQYPTTEAKRAAIIAMLSEQQEIDEETAKTYIEKMTPEQIDEQMQSIAVMMATKMHEAQVDAQMGALPQAQKAAMLDAMLQSADEATLASYYDEFTPAKYSEYTHKQLLEKVGYVDFESPSGINIYASTFEDKDSIADLIAKYNDSVEEKDKISYTDIVAIAMSGISTIINVISYVLIAFVSISLVVSSIMIGIITYISVLERTKEIGILRAIGASKSDISRVFNAETLIVGFVSGLIGITATILLCIPANAIIQGLSGINNISAQLPPVAAAILVAISMLLTFIAGLVPSKIAAKKDPVVALRSE